MMEAIKIVMYKNKPFFYVDYTGVASSKEKIEAEAKEWLVQD